MPSHRSFIAMSLAVVWLFIYAFVIMLIGSQFTHAPQWIQLPFYAVAGVVWIFPLRPLMKWAARAYVDREEP